MNASQDIRCHLCGAVADAVFDDVGWCAGCLHVQGSCCAGDDESACGEEHGSDL